MRNKRKPPPILLDFSRLRMNKILLMSIFVAGISFSFSASVGRSHTDSNDFLDWPATGSIGDATSSGDKHSLTEKISDGMSFGQVQMAPVNCQTLGAFETPQKRLSAGAETGEMQNSIRVLYEYENDPNKYAACFE